MKGAADGLRGSGTSSKPQRSAEHTSELQSLTNLVCRLLLEKTAYLSAPPLSTSVYTRYFSTMGSLSTWALGVFWYFAEFFFLWSGAPPIFTSFPPPPISR